MKYPWIISLLLSCALHANQTNPVAIQGNVEVEHIEPHHCQISVSEGAFVYWDEFSIGEDEIVEVVQPSSESIAIFEVVHNIPSVLLGTLKANGNVFITNTNGMLVGQDGCVDAAGFLVSSLPGCPCPLINKDYDVSIQGQSQALIVNQGRIKANAGDVYLIGRQLVNQGAIDAPLGVAALAAGENIVLNLSNGQKIGVIPSPMKLENDETGIDNSGMITARKIEMKADGNSYDNAILHVGLINAAGQNAEVYLVADKGNNILHGGVSAENSDGTGGTVYILGENIFLFKDAIVDVSGDLGGGNIFIGAGSDGKNSKEIQAKMTFVDEDVYLYLDAIEEGDGGQANIFASDAAYFYGYVSAIGGEFSGNGGSVEIIGQNSLDYQGNVDCSSSNGGKGTVFLSSNDDDD